MNVQYLTFRQKLIRIGFEKNKSESDPKNEIIDLKISFINIKKPQQTDKTTTATTNNEYSKSLNKKGYFEIVGFEKGIDHKIKSSSIEYQCKTDKFISLQSQAIINDTIQNQFLIYLLIQVKNDEESKKQLRFVYGYFDLSTDTFNIVNRFQLPDTSTTTTTNGPSSLYTHKILDGPNIVSFNNSNNTFYTQTIDNSGYSDDYKWVSFEYKSTKDSKPISYYTTTTTITTSNSDSGSEDGNEDIYQQIEIPTVITYTHQPVSIFNKITLNNNNNDNSQSTVSPPSIKQKITSNNTILNSLQAKKEITNQNEFHVIKSIGGLICYAILVDTTISIFNSVYDDKPIWELKLPKRPLNIHFTSIPLIFITNNNNNGVVGNNKQVDEKFKWSQGCVVVNYQKEDGIQVYSLSTKQVLNEVVKVQEVWINDFLSYGFDQVLIRHIPPEKSKVVTLSMIPLNWIPDTKKIKLLDDGNTSQQPQATASKRPVALEMIMESLTKRSLLANQEYKELEQQYKSKQSLLDHSLKVLESFGKPTSFKGSNSSGGGGDIGSSLTNWDYEFISLFKGSETGVEDKKQLQLFGVSSNEPIKPILESKSISIRGNTLYCNIELKKSFKPYTIVSAFLCCKDIFQLVTKLHFTISNCNHVYGIDIDGIGSTNNNTTTLLLETSLQNLNIDFNSTNLINIFIEWGFTITSKEISPIESPKKNQNGGIINSTTTSIGGGNQINEISYSNDNIYSTFLDSFYLNDYIGKKQIAQQPLVKQEYSSSIRYPFELDFIITGNRNSIEKLKLKQLFTMDGFSVYENHDKSVLIFTSNDDPFISFEFNSCGDLISFHINSVCLFTLLVNLKVFIDKVKSVSVGGSCSSININLSNRVNENTWNFKLKKELLAQLKDEFVMLSTPIQDSSHFSSKNLKETFLKYHQFYQKVYQSKIETQSLLYHLELLNKFN